MAINQPVRALGAAGFTLIELLIVLGLAAVLVLLAAPSFSEWLQGVRQRNQAQALANAFYIARSEAIKRNARVSVCKTSDGSTCADIGDWQRGWLVYADADRDGAIDPDEPVLRREGPGPSEVSITGNAPVSDYVSYTGLGHARLRNGGLQMGTFIVCAPRRPVLRVVLANSGRVRIQQDSLRCP